MFTFALHSMFRTSVVALLITLLTGCAVTHTDPHYGAGKDQRAAAEVVLERQVIPKLLATLTAEKRWHLGPESVTVTASLEPTQIALR